jgi:hypothetical protein
MGRARAKRQRARGAAMIESVIVISTMLIFMGLIVWMRQAYGTKLDLQQRTRSDVLYFASHACEDNGGGGGQASGGGTVPGGNPVGGAAGASGLPEGQAASRSWNSASSSLTGSANGQAIFDQNAKGQGGSINYGKMPLNSSIKAASACTCNEKKYTSQLTAWAKFGIDMVKSGGGIVDLFK